MRVLRELTWLLEFVIAAVGVGWKPLVEDKAPNILVKAEDMKWAQWMR